MKDDLRKDLTELPVKIKEQENIINATNRKADNIKYAKVSIELRHTGQIARENVNGKKMYPNADARDEELYKRLKSDDDYQALLSSEIETSMKLNETTVEYNYLRRKFTSTQYFVRLLEVKE